MLLFLFSSCICERNIYTLCISHHHHLSIYVCMCLCIFSPVRVINLFVRSPSGHTYILYMISFYLGKKHFSFGKKTRASKKNVRGIFKHIWKWVMFHGYRQPTAVRITNNHCTSSIHRQTFSHISIETKRRPCKYEHNNLKRAYRCGLPPCEFSARCFHRYSTLLHFPQGGELTLSTSSTIAIVAVWYH